MVARMSCLLSSAFILASFFVFAELKPTGSLNESVSLYCPRNFVLLDIRCYYFSTEMADSFPDAELRCSERFSELTTLSTPHENTIVKNYVRQNLVVQGLEGWWIGGVKLPDNGEDWVWTSNLYRIADADWCSGEPNNYGGESCLSLNPKCDFQWNDRSCDYYGFRYICETLAM